MHKLVYRKYRIYKKCLVILCMFVTPRMAEKPDSVVEELKCPVCFDYFEKPKYLLCNHVFCEACINKLPRHRREEKQVVQCPICRKPTSTPIQADNRPVRQPSR